MKTFQLSNGFTVDCDWKKTRTAFKHTAKIKDNYVTVYETKICYQNRTWECYEYESVLLKAIENYFKGEGVTVVKDKEDSPFKTVNLAATVGDVLCTTQEEKNAWKKKMYATIPGISFPEDWDALSEDEKTKRLDGMAKHLA